VLTACDFFTVELLVGRKLVRCTLFFVMELATRKVLQTNDLQNYPRCDSNAQPLAPEANALSN
jgi:hypothetical protein